MMEVLNMLFSSVEKHAEKQTGLTAAQIRAFSPEEFRHYLEKKNKKPLSFNSEFPVIGRGNVLRDDLVYQTVLDSEIDKILR